jgi:hypothetical protein
MQQQIRGWRFAAERTRRRRGSRDVPIASSAKMMGGMALMACRAFGQMAMRAQTRRQMAMRARAPGRMAMRAKMPGRMATRTRPRAGIPAMPAVDSVNMKRVAGGLGVLMAGMGVARWMSARSHMTKDRAPKNRWIMVTINCSPQRLASRADLPEPITRLGDAVDIKICPAPGDRGTELGARLRDLPRTKIAGMVTRRPEEDPHLMVEEALRQAKSLIEAGEVIRPDWPPTGQPAQVGKLLEFAGRRGGRL